MGATFRMPAPNPAAFAVLDSLPGWLGWGRRLVERWGAGTTYEVSAAELRVYPNERASADQRLHHVRPDRLRHR